MSSLRERLLRHKKTEAAPGKENRNDFESAPEVSGQDVPDQEHPVVDGLGDGAGADPRVSCEPANAANNEWQPVGGHMETTEWGSFVLRRRTYAAGSRHGKYELAELLGQAEHLSVLYTAGSGREEGAESSLSSAEERGAFHERLLFIDTETTGLGLGAGNVPFMVGIGYYHGADYIVEQMLIRHPGEEIAMLAYLQEKLEEHPILISYNGKSFDWPIVKNRYIMNRMTLAAEPEGHIDFLYPSRSLWKHTLPSCRLGKVEEERLMVHREDDVPGSLAPALYFQYLAEKDPTVLKGVFVHNELDILSLAGLAVHFAGVLSGRIDWRHIRQFGYEEWFRLGLWLNKAGKQEAAEAAMNALTEALLSGETDAEAERRFSDRDSEFMPTPADDMHEYDPGQQSVAEAGLGSSAGSHRRDAEPADGSAYWLPLAQYYKHLGRYDLACRLWTRYIELKGERSTASLEPYIELSMYYEHREKQWQTALKYASLALDKLWQRGALKRSGKGKLPGGHPRTREASGKGSKEAAAEKDAEALRKRIERLERKASAASSAKAGSDLPRTRTGSSGRATKQAEQLALPFEQSV